MELMTSPDYTLSIFKSRGCCSLIFFISQSVILFKFKVEYHTNVLAYLCFSVLDVVQASVPVSSDIDKRYYDHLISSVSPESHSVPLILHCLLEQVSTSNVHVVKILIIKSQK